jgi:hypothetical protein
MQHLLGECRLKRSMQHHRYKAVFKGGVYETRETVWALSGAEERRVASLEGGADAA